MAWDDMRLLSIDRTALTPTERRGTPSSAEFHLTEAVLLLEPSLHCVYSGLRVHKLSSSFLDFECRPISDAHNLAIHDLNGPGV
jgi:hypothetical protein